ncbi:MAG: thiamine pyrophosphate-binding protein [Azonexus sp.]|jgi:acetolactate synthase-1/2/3 large subunit|uniref:thiamine pyrophosphate-binding protein n=1 Tax=Azonexus sp. TaxID=1872668 RepID=UPI00282CC705|nr:thiamine pyrophosphate-binding protein [Azonexus sp.]MDR0777706.1 thiamine pyrophosphate-binding protein [Azonexus sp.]
MRLADYLMARLADAGAEHVFLLPGGGAMHLNDALVCEKRLHPVPCHHEQACGIAAEAWGRVRELFGVCLVTTGPGATNAVTPVAGAWIESLPLLVISGQVKRADRLNGRPLRQGGVQEVDIVPMVRSVTKYAVTVDDPQQIRFHLEKALYLMRDGRPGPVWLDIPLDVQAAQIDPAHLPAYIPPAATETADLAAAAAEVVARLEQARRPLILAGHGVRIAGAAQDFAALAERLGVPVVTTWNALDLLPFDHPLNIGRPGVVAARAPNFAVQNCDLLIAIGSRLDNIITAYNPKGFARAAHKIAVDVDADELERLAADVDQRIVADAGAFIRELAGRARPATCRPWLDRCQDWKRRYPADEGRVFPSSGPLSHYHFISALSACLPPDIIVSTGSSGLAVEVFYTAFRNKPGQRVFLTSGLGAMGYGLPAAIGACLAGGGQPMVAIESDGSLQLNLQELGTLQAQRLPITLIILNNGGYASIRNTQRNYFAGRFVGTGPEAGLLLPDLAAIAAAYALPYTRIDDAVNLPVLRNALAGGGPQIIDVHLLPDETLTPKCAALPQADGSMLSMPLEDMSPLLPLEQLRAEMSIPLHPASLSAPR